MFWVVEYVCRFGVFVVVDGGIRFVGYIIKVFVFGVLIVMMGLFLVGIIEILGEYFFLDGVWLKKYRGENMCLIRMFVCEGMNKDDFFVLCVIICECVLFLCLFFGLSVWCSKE